jgi:hypothetical protein
MVRCIMIASGLKSPRWACRKYGCTEYVPHGGFYAGLPQAYCYYCHMRQVGCMEGGGDSSGLYKPYKPTFLDKLLFLVFPLK